MLKTDYAQVTPFMPPAEDLVMQGVTATGVKFYIFDTYCKSPLTPEEKAEKDRRILDIYARSEWKKRLRSMDDCIATGH